MITWKRAVIFLIIAIFIIACYDIFFATPEYYMDGGGFLEPTGRKYGTGVPYNMFNTSGRIVKQNPYDYFYIYKKGSQPGIYKVTYGGRESSLLTENSARYLNLYKDEETDVEWIYYIDDNNTLWRVNDSGTVDEPLLDNCLYIFIIGGRIFYTTMENKIYENRVDNLASFKAEEPTFYAQTVSPLFAYRNGYQLYYESPSPSGGSISYLWVEYSNVFDSTISFSKIPDTWYPYYHSDILYVEDGNLYASSSFNDTATLIYEGIADNSRIYYTGKYIFFEGEKENGSDRYPFYRIDAHTGDNLTRVLWIDNIPLELYLFENHLFQYDTEKGDLHKVYNLKVR